MFIAPKVARASATETRDKPHLPTAGRSSDTVNKGRHVRGYVIQNHVSSVRQIQSARCNICAHKHYWRQEAGGRGGVIAYAAQHGRSLTLSHPVMQHEHLTPCAPCGILRGSDLAYGFSRDELAKSKVYCR